MIALAWERALGLSSSSPTASLLEGLDRRHGVIGDPSHYAPVAREEDVTVQDPLMPVGANHLDLSVLESDTVVERAGRGR
jgi:hypothetical protein